MIEIDISEEMKAAATKLADDMGKLNNSITGGKGNIAGK
jgi:hypothetical protein|tara:strand:- start:22987 stop:23103 length:117 start_codon:yes stop_codon:yes gene_type:complete